MVHRRKSIRCAFANSFRTQKGATADANSLWQRERDVKTSQRGSCSTRQQHEAINAALVVKHPHKLNHQRRRDASARSQERLHASLSPAVRERAKWNELIRRTAVSAKIAGGTNREFLPICFIYCFSSRNKTQSTMMKLAGLPTYVSMSLAYCTSTAYRVSRKGLPLPRNINQVISNKRSRSMQNPYSLFSHCINF